MRTMPMTHPSACACPKSTPESLAAVGRQAKAGDRAADERPSRQPFVGVDTYSGLGKTRGPRGDNGCDLGYSSADARILANTIERRVGEPCQGDRRLRRG